MKRAPSPLRRRLFAALTWFVFLFCSAIIVTGFLVGSTSPLEAQEAAVEEVKVDASAQQAQAADNIDRARQDAADAAQSAGAPPIADAPPSADEQTAKEAPRAPPEAADPASADADSTDNSKVQNQIVLGNMEGDSTPLFRRLLGFLGLAILLFVAWLMSTNRKRINWRPVAVGLGLQLSFALFIFYFPLGPQLFQVATGAVTKLLEFTDAGSSFIFESYVTQQWEPALINFAFSVLPTIIFFSSLMTILYHLGIMQKVVMVFAKVMQKTMNISGAESTSAAANIFVGQTEAPLVIKPFVNNMTRSELMVVMTGGFATVAGGVLAIYVGMMDAVFPDIAGHLIAASIMGAPAALVISKIVYPEVDEPETMGRLEMSDEREDANVLDAASRGAAEGLKLALNVGAMLLAFIALITLVNHLISLPSLWYNGFTLKGLAKFYASGGLAIPEGCDPATVADTALVGCVETMQAAAGAPQSWIAPMISIQDILGLIFWPFAFVMGVPIEDCYTIAQLLGEKMVINELIAYSSLQQLLLDPEVMLSKRSVVIATYALCGFANIGSIGIQLGGIGGIAPDRKKDLAEIAVRAMLGGTLASFMTATIAGILV